MRPSLPDYRTPPAAAAREFKNRIPAFCLVELGSISREEWLGAGPASFLKWLGRITENRAGSARLRRARSDLSIESIWPYPARVGQNEWRREDGSRSKGPMPRMKVARPCDNCDMDYGCGAEPTGNRWEEIDTGASSLGRSRGCGNGGERRSLGFLLSADVALRAAQIHGTHHSPHVILSRQIIVEIWILEFARQVTQLVPKHHWQKKK